jgi:hypothetical protein
MASFSSIRANSGKHQMNLIGKQNQAQQDNVTQQYSIRGGRMNGRALEQLKNNIQDDGTGNNSSFYSNKTTNSRYLMFRENQMLLNGSPNKSGVGQ